ncbi:cytochrome c oxidase subunit 4 [Allonocardiopsis opalescens]|uniref:Cytochrome c oxidase polypeptide 4 n=1 Tax=Allonocardiopsis opalescens TaxID=1144618 RepID=A0A2T0PZT5_9ACTN|nr:cytochrome c oxidase subunit 4 [Allonocardiopsis opalescens]PRX97048.1 cytochrome c oxidase subunit IV [Allonocardiopsis opalescens]
MKFQAYLFIGVGLFFGLCAAIYAYWTGLAGGIEWTGTVALIVSVFMALMIGSWLLVSASRIERVHGRAPEDQLEGEIADNAGELGFFSPHSWWPLFVAMSVALAAVGFVIGWWLLAIGVAAVLLTVMGMVFEYYRGHFEH